jgi:hypothetical protein
MPPKKKDNLDDLKQELDIDYHKISSEELYQRFQTHPENVSIGKCVCLKQTCILSDFFYCLTHRV